jgi:phage shock protein E
MKKTLIVAVIIVAGIAAFILMSPKSDSAQQSNGQNTQQSNKFADIQKEVSAGAQLIDVRTADEFNQSHFASATNFTLQDMVAGKLPSVAKDTKIYLYCQSGNRAGQAYMILKSAGFTNIEKLGGLSDVEALGGKLQKS